MWLWALHTTATLWTGWICCSKNPFSALFNYWKRCKFGQTSLFNNANDTEYSCRWVKIWPLTVNKYFAHKDGSPVCDHFCVQISYSLWIFSPSGRNWSSEIVWLWGHIISRNLLFVWWIRLYGIIFLCCHIIWFGNTQNQQRKVQNRLQLF